MQENDKDKSKKKSKKPRASGAVSKKKASKKKVVKKKAARKPDASPQSEGGESQGQLIPEAAESGQQRHDLSGSGDTLVLDNPPPGQVESIAESSDGLPQGGSYVAGGGDADEVEEPVMQGAAKVLFSEFSERGMDDTEMVEYLLFRMDGEGYALLVSEVNEILRHQRITRVPRTALHVLGATSLRGTIIPVINLGSLLSGNEGGTISDGRILVLKDVNSQVGVLVEKGIGIVSLGDEMILPPPPNASGETTVFIRGVLNVKGEFYTVLKSEAIIRSKATMEA